MLLEIFFYHELVIEFLVIAIASSILGITYLRNPYIAYLLVQDIYKIMIIQKTGLLCYSKDVSKEIKIDDFAIAGLLFAIISFGSEVLGVEDKYERVNVLAFGRRKIVVKPYYDIIGIIIANEVSDALINALDKFTVEFWKRYGDHVKMPGVVTRPIDADDLLEREFSLILP